MFAVGPRRVPANSAMRTASREWCYGVETTAIRLPCSVRTLIDLAPQFQCLLDPPFECAVRLILPASPLSPLIEVCSVAAHNQAGSAHDERCACGFP